MKNFLDNYISSLSAKRRATISEVLASTTLSKNDLENIATRLMDFKKTAPLSFNGESFGTFIRSSAFDSVIREVRHRMTDIYNSSNNISLLLDTYSSVLISEIKAIEDEIFSIEKTINNYGFSLSDGGFFDYIFIETFNDETMRDFGPISDRSGKDFDESEYAIVNSSTAMLSLNSSLLYKVPLTAQATRTNCGLTIDEVSQDLSLALNSDPTDGWRLSISSSRPINSNIDNNQFTGAQVEIELLPTNPIPCSNLILTPYADLPIDLVSVKIFESLDQDLETVFEAIGVESGTNLVIDKPTNVDFPMKNVAKILLTINQSIYSRGSLSANQAESTHRVIYDSVKDMRRRNEDVIPYRKNKKALIRVFNRTISNVSNNQKRFFRTQIPQLNFHAVSGPLTMDKMGNLHRLEKGKDEIWNYDSKLNHFIRRMVHERIFSDSYQILNDRYIYNITNNAGQRRTSLDQVAMSGNNQEFPRIEALEPEVNVDLISAESMTANGDLSYKYDIGLRNIELGSGLKIYRGIFISKSIPAPGDSTEIKLKVEDLNYRYINSARDSKMITSIEYSISNKSNPNKEDDWVPVLPIDTDSVIAERLFVNAAGDATLRFLASRENELMVYKNGYQLTLDQFSLTMSVNNNSIKGVKIPLGFFTSDDIFTIDYTPYGDESLINFTDRGFGQSVLASAYDEQGAGETFNMTPADKVITLSRNPYIDYSQATQFGSYSAEFGFQGSYQPITIVLEDGTVALNQTNYIGVNQNNLNVFNDTHTAYIHSGTNIIFNRDISQKFTVYYQYLPSNLRYRIVMRVNDTTHISPTINTVQIKSKTKKADPRSLF